MGLNHTIQLYNYPAVQGMCDLINKNVWVDCIITEFRRKYFNEKTIKEELACVADHMSAILASEGTVYIKVNLEDIPLVSEVFVNHCFRLKNLLTIKIPVEHLICRINKYIDCGVNYVYSSEERTIILLILMLLSIVLIKHVITLLIGRGLQEKQ